jgi:hypothetical protein
VRALLAVLLPLALVACALPPDLEQAGRRLLDSPPRLPPLSEDPPAPLPAPEGLQTESGGFRAVRLQWEPLLVGQVGGYAVERSFVREGPFERIAAVPGRFATVYVDRGPPPDAANPAPALGDGATVFYRVRAFSETGRLSGSVSEVGVATTAPPPLAPVDLRAYSLQPRMVPLSWRAPEDPTLVGYVVERSPSSQGPFEPVAHLDGRDATVWVDRDLGDLRVLYYRVVGVNAAGAVGAPAPAVRAVTKPEPLPPYHLRVVEQHLGANRVAWDPNVEPDLTGYRLLRRRGGDALELVAELPPETTTALDPEVAADEPVAYSLVALDRDGLQSDAAGPLSLTSVGYGLSASAGTDGVRLRWNPRREEGWERAHVLRDGRLRARELAVVEGAEYVDRDVEPGHSYRYTIVLEAAGERRAPPSTPLEVTVPES